MRVGQGGGEGGLVMKACEESVWFLLLEHHESD